MKRKVFIVAAAILSLSVSVSAQELPTAAVYATGNIVYDDAKTIAALMTASLVNTGRYRAVENPEAFISELNSELLAAADGSAGENPVSKVGKRFGVSYVCIADVTPVSDALQITAYVMDVETAGALFIGGAVGAVKALPDLTALADNAVKDMLSKPAAAPAAEAPAAEAAAPEAAPAAPEPAEPRPAGPDAGIVEGGVSVPDNEAQAADAKKAKKPRERQGGRQSAGIGGTLAGDFGGGVKYASGAKIAMPYYGGSGYLFYDFVYAEFFAGYAKGRAKWASPNASSKDLLPLMKRDYLNFGLLAKYPFDAGILKIFPLLGIDYQLSVSGAVYPKGGGGYKFDGGDDAPRGQRPGPTALSALWFAGGAGADYAIGGAMYARIEALYGYRTPNSYESDIINNRLGDALKGNFAGTLAGHGLTLKLGLGFNL